MNDKTDLDDALKSGSVSIENVSKDKMISDWINSAKYLPDADELFSNKFLIDSIKLYLLYWLQKSRVEIMRGCNPP